MPIEIVAALITAAATILAAVITAYGRRK